MLLPNRHGNSSEYRYGFQGQELDNEIKGEGNSLNFKYRMHDPRLGRFFAPDPLEGKFPWWSPYQFSGNRPIDSQELEGAEIEFIVWDPSLGGKSQVQVVQTIDEIKQESEIVFLTDLFGWTITQTANLRDLGIINTYILYNNEWKLVPQEKVNQSLYEITRKEWDSYNTLDDINNTMEVLRAIGSKAELAVNLVELGDGLRNLYDFYKSIKNAKKGELLPDVRRIKSSDKIDVEIDGGAKGDIIFKANKGVDGDKMVVKDIYMYPKGATTFKDKSLVGKMGREVLKFKNDMVKKAKKEGIKTLLLEFYRTPEGSTARGRGMIMEIDVKTGKTIRTQEISTSQHNKNNKKDG
ncbi:hypothetical protein AB832_06220 [Flavobacteriaceae bacterium (ex Bugula neritina AB1)]|nr:hypothetical protein AB832_06220 [Flavobacteriaceae bacterium (ex Bugula neritina AB1)]